MLLVVCRGGVCRKTPPSVTNLCRDMAAQACYKPIVFHSLPCVYLCVCMCTSVCICTRIADAYMYMRLHTCNIMYANARMTIFPVRSCSLIHGFWPFGLELGQVSKSFGVVCTLDHNRLREICVSRRIRSGGGSRKSVQSCLRLHVRDAPTRKSNCIHTSYSHAEERVLKEYTTQARFMTT